MSYERILPQPCIKCQWCSVDVDRQDVNNEVIPIRNYYCQHPDHNHWVEEPKKFFCFDSLPEEE